MFVLRQARQSDLDALETLAGHLNTLNLPPDREFLSSLLARVEASFVGGEDPTLFDPERRFMFVLESPDGEVVGTSMILAQHGTAHEPHVFFHVDQEERYARLELADEQREVHMAHQLLRLGMTYRGPTEVGGLVLNPKHRGHPHKLGRLLSLSRFVYMGVQRHWFRERVLAELLPPLDTGPSGETRSPLWDALGSRFTGLTYDEADTLSRDDKAFIWKLFPQTPIHTAMLPPAVRENLGRVGKGSRGAQRLLESIGFTDSGKVDPFDGGPHFEADTDELVSVRELRSYAPVAKELPTTTLGAVVASQSADEGFRAVWTAVEAVPDAFDDKGELTQVYLRQNAIDALGNPERVHVALRPELRSAVVPWRLPGG